MDPQIPPQMGVGYHVLACCNLSILFPQKLGVRDLSISKISSPKPASPAFRVPRTIQSATEAPYGVVRFTILLPAIRPRQMVLPMELGSAEREMGCSSNYASQDVGFWAPSYDYDQEVAFPR
jgi:hypothetical protein